MSNGVRPSACPTRRRRLRQRPYHDHARPQRRRPARARRRGRATSTAARWTASSRAGAARAAHGCRRIRTHPRCSLGAGDARRDGLPRRARDPELLGVRAALRPPGPHVRAGHVVEPAGAPLHGLGVVGAAARRHGDPMSCVNARRRTPGSPPDEPQNPTGATPDYAWTDLTYLLHQHHVSWRYYVVNGHAARLRRRRDGLHAASRRTRRRPGIWNPLPWFDTVQQRPPARQHPAARRTSTRGASAGTLPAVSWIVPDQTRQRAPARRSISDGQAYVTEPDQRGHAQPRLEARPRSSSPGTTGAASTTTSRRRPSTRNGYGLRVPGLVISPYAQRGLHRPPDAELRRLPEVHRGRLPPPARLDPTTDGRPDPRPTCARTCRSSATCVTDFDFTQKPRPPLLLPLHPPFS